MKPSLMKLVQQIIELSDLVGISSREYRITENIKSRFANSTYKLDVDNIGNVTLSHQNNDTDKKNILIFAHMDEIGLIVRKITDDGYIYFERLGGVNTQILPGTKFILDASKGLVEGVIGVQSHHFMQVDNKFKVPPIQSLYIDICASSRQEVLDQGIDVGTMGVFKSKCEVIHDKYIRGKALDNRVAMAILLRLAEELENDKLDYNLHFCFPVMEEFNIRGLLPVIRKIKPDISIGIDITPTCDTPDLDYNTIHLGGGPAITYMNFHGGGTLAGVLPDKELIEKFENIARKENIKIQREISPGVITENAFCLFENENGVKVANLSIPTRYTHTPFETESLEDIQSMYKLLKHILLDKF